MFNPLVENTFLTLLHNIFNTHSTIMVIGYYVGFIWISWSLLPRSPPFYPSLGPQLLIVAILLALVLRVLLISLTPHSVHLPPTHVQPHAMDWSPTLPHEHVWQIVPGLGMIPPANVSVYAPYMYFTLEYINSPSVDVCVTEHPVMVGGLPQSTTEGELMYSNVKYMYGA